MFLLTDEQTDNSGIRQPFPNINIERSSSSRYYCTCSQLRPAQIESNMARSQSLWAKKLYITGIFFTWTTEKKGGFPKNTSGNPRPTIHSDPFILCGSTTKLREKREMYGGSRSVPYPVSECKARAELP